ncbi:MAG: hypothetical protein S4CHLAM37_01660 [Chlamydiia bacterium]|nr:hypothetical protein [Chlamydiia bacterium]
MKVFALADFHLSFALKNKSMEIFGENWKNWTEAIETNCHEMIKPEDLLLIAGDISWATKLEDALVDLEWIDKLPGTKLLLKGNHDYWWSSYSKIKKILPATVHLIHNNSFTKKNVTIGGSRLWDTPEYNFKEIAEVKDNPLAKKETRDMDEIHKENEKIFARELQRLQLSLDTLCKTSKYRIAMTHYPPIGLDLKQTKASSLIEAYHIDYCVFGHLHNLNTKKELFGRTKKCEYSLTSCDYLDFKPKLILD